MRIAWCLRGQPRDVEAGHAIIRSFINKHPSITFDFYCHTWFHPDPNHIYAVSTYRRLGNVRQDIDVIGKIEHLYKPVKHSIDAPKDFDIEPRMASKAIQNIRNRNILNLKNTTSNLYSQTQVRNVLYENMKSSYDFVISSRYDIYKEITLDLHTLEKDKMYCSSALYPRKCFVENLYIMPPSIFFDVCSIYSILDKLVDNSDIIAKLQATREELAYTPEILMTACLYYFNYMEHVVYSRGIPYFV